MPHQQLTSNLEESISRRLETTLARCITGWMAKGCCQLRYKCSVSEQYSKYLSGFRIGLVIILNIFVDFSRFSNLFTLRGHVNEINESI